jgi:hypothetical protein
MGKALHLLEPGEVLFDPAQFGDDVQSNALIIHLLGNGDPDPSTGWIDREMQVFDALAHYIDLVVAYCDCCCG